MEFPKSFRVVLLVTVYVSALMVAADLNEEKKAAIKKVENLFSSAKACYEKTVADLDGEKKKLAVIEEHWTDFGIGTRKDLEFKFTRIIQTAKFKAKILGSSSKVIKCIEDRERETYDKSKISYSKFLKEFNYATNSALETVEREIRWWQGDYNRDNRYYTQDYERTVKDIQKATDSKTITKAVKDFDMSTSGMKRVIQEIFREMAKIQLIYLTNSDSYVGLLKIYNVVDRRQLIEDIPRCFPKFYQQKIFFNPKLF